MIGKWLMWLFGPNDDKPRSIPVEDTDDGKLYIKLMKNRCPDCGAKGFYEGPSGGMSTNIFCTNRECRQGFNITPVVEIAERIHKADIEIYPKENRHAPSNNRAKGTS